MTTMLEKAAWALSRLSSHCEMPDGAVVSPEDSQYFIIQARAALLAIREPSDAWVWNSPFLFEDAQTFTAMIDAILNEKPETT